MLFSPFHSGKTETWNQIAVAAVAYTQSSLKLQIFIVVLNFISGRMEKKRNVPTLKKRIILFVMILWEHQLISEESEHIQLRRTMQYTHIIK